MYIFAHLWPYISVSGGAAVVLYFMVRRRDARAPLFVPGWVYEDKNKECEELKEAIRIERQRGDAAVAAANITRDVLLSIQSARDANVVQKKDE
jgi:hypothetical protein